MPINTYLSGIVCLLLGLSVGVARTQTPPAPLTVEEAVATALRQNPLRRAAISATEAAGAGVGAARALANPAITIAPTIAGAMGSDEELSVIQPLEISGTRSARAGVARAELRAAQSDAVVSARDLVREVKFAYYELARAREVLALQQESVAIAEEFERIARRQVELGARPGIDLTQLQVESTRARQLQAQAETDVRVAEVTLNTLMGRLPQTPIPAVSRLALSLTTPASVEEALARRAEIAVEEARLEALRHQARLVRAEGRPDLALFGRLESFTRAPRVGGVGLGMTLPLLDYGSRRHRLRQSRHLAEAQAARVEVLRRQVRLDVEAALARLRTAEQLLHRYQEGLLDQARRLAEAERTRFQTGAGSPLAVLEAQRTYRSVLSDYYGALAAHEQALAELEWATGSGPQFPVEKSRVLAPLRGARPEER